LAAFEGVRKAHTHYRNAFNRTLALALRSCPGKVVIVTGPSGVGKSTLAVSLQNKVYAEASNSCDAHPAYVPAMLLRATAPHAMEFSWKDFFTRLLEGLCEPLRHKELQMTDQLDLWSEIKTLLRADHTTADGLRRQAERALDKRRTRVIIIDEAQHLLLCRNATSLRHQFEAIKSFADMSGVTIILVGTYDLLRIRDQSAQLIRRGQIVHFPRYDFAIKEHRSDFKSAMAALTNDLPIPLAPEVATDTTYFYLKTAGCIGILRDLLRDSLSDALELGQQCISRATIDANAQPNKAIRRILAEAVQGEALLEDIPLGDVESLVRMPRAELLAALAPVPPTRPTPNPKEDSTTPPTTLPEKQDGAKRSLERAGFAIKVPGRGPGRPRKRAPGERAPRRESVGYTRV
jgi:type II secretory pathway predicted ATPase ExeA